LTQSTFYNTKGRPGQEARDNRADHQDRLARHVGVREHRRSCLIYAEGHQTKLRLDLGRMGWVARVMGNAIEGFQFKHLRAGVEMPLAVI
jgi:hypothetical protein